MNAYDLLKDKNFMDYINNIDKTIMFVALVGSHGQRLNSEHSDIDIIIVVENTIDELLGVKECCSITPSIKGYHCNIVSFKDLIQNLIYGIFEDIELLGLSDEFYCLINGSGKLFLENKRLFITKHILRGFDKYINKELTWFNDGDKNAKSKAMMHLVRAYYEMSSILKNEDIWFSINNKENINFLLNIKNGYYLNDDGSIKIEFYEFLNNYKIIFNDIESNSKITNVLDIDKINNLVININKVSIKEVKNESY